ncbi:hypothetical protein THAOC_31462, partial [Thalassiosira oceanica]
HFFAVAENGGSSSCSSSASDQECSRDSDAIGESSRSRGPTLRQLERQRRCDAQEDEERHIYTQEDWERLRRLYRDQGGTTVEYPEGEVMSVAPPGFVPPMVARQTADGKGRGIFATRNITKGSMTYGGKDNYAFFSTGEAFRRFVGALSDSEACDVMMWAWPQVNMGRDFETLIVVLLDSNSLQNHASKNGGHGGLKGGQVANTGCPRGMECGMFDEYALIDIREGDEFLCDYDDFFDADLWEEFGL